MSQRKEVTHIELLTNLWDQATTPLFLYFVTIPAILGWIISFIKKVL